MFASSFSSSFSFPPFSSSDYYYYYYCCCCCCCCYLMTHKHNLLTVISSVKRLFIKIIFKKHAKINNWFVDGDRSETDHASNWRLPHWLLQSRILPEDKRVHTVLMYIRLDYKSVINEKNSDRNQSNQRYKANCIFYGIN